MIYYRIESYNKQRTYTSAEPEMIYYRIERQELTAVSSQPYNHHDDLL